MMSIDPRRAPVAAALAVSLAALLLTSALGGVADAAKAKKPVAKSKRPATTIATTVAPAAPTSAPSPASTAAPAAGVTVDGITGARCQANRAAGKITYLSGFDYAASASIVEMIVADAKGYFAKMCLDVDVKASFSTANYGLVADNKAQFASAGSYVELLRNTPKERPLVAVYNLGKTAIETLMVRDDGKITSILDMRNKTIGIKGDLPPSIQVMLAKNGLKRGVDYKEQIVDGFNPVAHFQLPIDALPGFKSNEPGQLERSGVNIRQFDPGRYNIPGSFGLVYTNAKFLKENPTAAQDFVRAALRGYADAAANPDEATALAVKRINDSGNRNFLSPVGEAYRWRTEAKIVADNTPSGQPVGLLVPNLLQAQLDSYTEAGVLPANASISGSFDESIVKAVTGANYTVIWPKG